MRTRLILVTLVVAVGLAGCGPIANPPWKKNPACERVDSSAASQALQREVKAERSPVEGTFWSCEYYPPSRNQALAGLALYDDKARETYESERASAVASGSEVALREEDIGQSAYSTVDPTSARAFALDGNAYLRVSVFVDRYGGSPEAVRQAAVRLLRQAVAG